MALKRLKVKMATAPAVKPGDIPVVRIEGDLIGQYNRASDQKKAAEGVMEDLKPEILELGLAEIFQRSCDTPHDPVPTVKLEDEDHETLRVQFVNKYGAVADIDGAEGLFERLTDPDGNPVDVNDFLQETVVAKFDCAVFNDAEGRFQKRVYDKFRQAIEKVAVELGVPCPLETTKAVKVLPALHERRWELFPDVLVQNDISRVCPNTVQVVPVRPRKNKAA